MKKNKKAPKKQGIISIVQSPNREKNNSDNLNESSTEDESDEPKEHGIISIVQSPDEATIGKMNE